MEPKILADIAAQLKRIADIMERTEKRNVVLNSMHNVNDGLEKIKEAVKLRKGELLRKIKNTSDSDTRRN